MSDEEIAKLKPIPGLDIPMNDVRMEYVYTTDVSQTVAWQIFLEHLLTPDHDPQPTIFGWSTEQSAIDAVEVV
jgi:hypothetical protein